MQCKKCQALEREVEYLRGLVDRCMIQIAPKPTEELDPELKAIQENENIEIIGE